MEGSYFLEFRLHRVPKGPPYLLATWLERCQNAAAYIRAVSTAMEAISPGWWSLAIALRSDKPGSGVTMKGYSVTA